MVRAVGVSAPERSRHGFRVIEVDQREPHLICNIGQTPRISARPVQGDNVIAVRDKTADQMRADKAGRAGYESPGHSIGLTQTTGKGPRRLGP
jgi:hypothetical protein